MQQQGQLRIADTVVNNHSYYKTRKEKIAQKSNVVDSPLHLLADDSSVLRNFVISASHVTQQLYLLLVLRGQHTSIKEPSRAEGTRVRESDWHAASARHAKGRPRSQWHTYGVLKAVLLIE